MHDTQDSALSRACDTMTEAIGEAVTWFDHHPGYQPAQRTDIARDLKNERRELRRLKRAATRPMCVAVFGPSQVGKSYLLSALAKRKDAPLSVQFGPDTFDFLNQINPEGEGTEATGLVTRFTTRPSQAPNDYPVHVKLHSLTDVVKIIANTYFLDFEVECEVDRAPSAQEVYDLVEAARARLDRGAGPGTLTEDDVLDLKEYVSEKFRKRETEKVLRETGFWDALLTFADRLPPDDWIPLFALLWGRVERFTRLFQTIRGALAQIGFAEEAYCHIDTLLNRARSIVNINTLDQLGLDDRGNEVALKTPQGQTARLSRSVLTAVIAELVLTLTEKPYDYFTHTDLLDFPGYRPRLGKPDIDKYMEEPDAFRELFRRGKVDYLFDSYRREQEITALLLCLSPGNQNTHAIPPLIHRWVDDTHGATASERASALTALFVVKTKFDTRFATGQGSQASSDERWENAIKREHLDYLGGPIKWPSEWTPGKPFTNIFWVRNPQFVNHNLMSYNEAEEEIGLRDPDTVQIYKDAYLANPLIQRYVHQPERAWEEAFRLNDGGVSYLADSLTPVCNPTIKSEQVRTRLTAAYRRILDRLSEHHVSSDIEAELDKRLEGARAAIDTVIDLAERGLFGHLMTDLQIASNDLRAALYRVAAGAGTNGSKPGNGTYGPQRSGSSMRSRIFGPSTKISAEPPGQDRKDRTQLAAEAAVDYWGRNLSSGLETADGLTTQETDAENLAAVARELVQAAARIDLSRHISSRLAEFTTSFENAEEFRDKQAVIAAEEINCFVWTLGYDRTPVEQRPTSYGPDGTPVPVFSRPIQTAEEIDFTSDPVNYLEAFVGDWCVAYHAMVRANVEQAEGPGVDVALNEQMGRIIGRISEQGQEI